MYIMQAIVLYFLNNTQAYEGEMEHIWKLF